jgi:hypothetical protein
MVSIGTLVTLGAVVVTTGCFDIGLIDAPLSCATSDDCLGERGCFDGRCVDVGPCLEDSAGVFTAAR